MTRRVILYSLVFAAAASIPALWFGMSAVLGLWAGDLMCLAGYGMIVHWTKAGFANGIPNYMVRFCFYGAILVLCLYLGLPALSLLAGITLQKAAVVLAGIAGKEQ